MSAGLNRILAALSAATLFLVGVVTAGSALATAASPPYEPDPNAVGTLSFYDASGNVITSGHTDTAPFAAYAAGSNAIRSGDDQAGLYFANPDPGKSTATYYRHLVGGFNAYPTSGTPASITALSQTRPVNIGSASDQTVNAFESSSTHSSAAGYQNVVQVRMRTAAGSAQGVPYETADLLIDPMSNTWTQIYPTPAASTVPAAPSGVTATPAILSANVSWSAPTDNGGSTITSYRVEYSTDGTTYVLGTTSTDTSATVSGPAAGTRYTFRVEAVNANGQSMPSTPSNSVTPTAATAPGAPTGVTARAGDASAAVSWNAPASNGGSAITGYQVEYALVGSTSYTPVTTPTAALSTTVTGLTNGSSYVLRVHAVNAAGTGPASTNSAAVTPVADASALSIGGPSSVRYGYTATITARLTDSTSRGVLARAPITLYGRHAHSGRWYALKTVTTSASGVASFGLKPTSYEQFYWHYNGTATHKATSSAGKAVYVTQTVAVKATATRIKAKKLIKVYGTVGPTGRGQRVYLQVYRHGWRTVTSAVLRYQTLPNHRRATGFVLGVRPAKGSKLYRVYKPATSTLLYGLSGQFHLAGK